MNNERDTLEPWKGLTNWEQQCVDEIEKSQDTENEFQNEKDVAVQKLWFYFQNAATCIAQLYKDRQHGISLWVPFQNAASSVTSLYKECVESHKPIYDVGVQYGYHKRNRDILTWAKKNKRYIRREDLIAYITGKTPPPNRQWGPRPRLSLESMRNVPHRSLTHSHRFVSADSSSLLAQKDNEPDFDMFREALTLSTSLKQHSPNSPTSNFLRIHRSRYCNPAAASHNELSAFITEEFIRHSRKRSPANDVIMESPTHKRSRLIPEY